MTTAEKRTKFCDKLRVNSLDELSEGEIIIFSECEKKVLAEIVSIPQGLPRPVFVYRIIGTGSIGVLNLKKKTVLKMDDHGLDFFNQYR